MSRKNKQTDDELATRLRARLRAGDPAGAGEDLSPGEVWEMRRRMLSAVPERRRPRLLLGLASAAAAALALALGIALHREVPPPAPLPETAAPTAPAAPAAPDARLAAPAPPPIPTTAAPAPDQVPAERPARAEHHRRRYPARSTVAVVASEPPPSAPEPPPSPPIPLQIQFDTPGGTRVVWVLEPAKP